MIDFLFNTLCYLLGIQVLKAVTLGRFNGKSSYWDGIAVALGALVLLSPLIIFITFKIITRGH